MIGRKPQDKQDVQEPGLQSFDDFTIRLGDVMRGERATLGKSLLDVQRELRIKASYIAAIENCDPSAFDTPGFIAGYVRSYARYLGLDPDETYAIFCEESGFSTAHGMSEKASSVRKPDEVAPPPRPSARDPLTDPKLPFAPVGDSVFSRIEPGAIGSSLVLLALIGGIGYGGWSVLQEIQRVQVAPVDQTPAVLSQLDPLDDAVRSAPADDPVSEEVAGVFSPPSAAAFDRLYRPEALDVPVVVSRDAPISTLDPSSVGLFAQAQATQLPLVQDSSAAAAALETGRAVLADTRLFTSDVAVMAARPAWVEIKDGGGQVIYSRIMDAGDAFEVPDTLVDAEIQIGDSGNIYFAVEGDTLGPSGTRGEVTRGLPLDADALRLAFEVVDVQIDEDLESMIADLRNVAPAAPVPAPVGSNTEVARAAPTILEQPTPGTPQVLAEGAPGVVIVATADTWVEVTAPSGKKLFAQVMSAGDTFAVPSTEEPSVVFSGNAGGVYFEVNGQTYGPYGQSGQFGRNLALDGTAISDRLQVADLTQNRQLQTIVAQLRAQRLRPSE